MALGSGIRDPRSGIRKKPIPDPGSRGQKDDKETITKFYLFYRYPCSEADWG